MLSKSLLARCVSIGALMAAALTIGATAVQAAGPQVVAGPSADPKCFAPWAADTKYVQYPAKKGPFRIALANGYIANSWRIQMIETAKAYAAQPDVAAKLKEFKVVSTGEDVPAQISAINNFIDSGYDAIVTDAQNPTAFGPVIKRAKEAGVILVALTTSSTRPMTSTSTSTRKASVNCGASGLSITCRAVARYLRCAALPARRSTPTVTTASTSSSTRRARSGTSPRSSASGTTVRRRR